MDLDEPDIRRIPHDQAGERLDRALARVFPEYSRTRLQQWLKAGHLQVDGMSPAPRSAVIGGESAILDPGVAEAVDPTRDAGPEPVAFDIVHEDDAIIVVDKPADLVVHPAAGHRGGTLQNGLLYYDPSLAALPRAGIVHRLDKDTTGLMVVARTLAAHNRLVAQLEERAIVRDYRAVVVGVPVAGGSIDHPVGRHPRDRQRQAVVRAGGRPAVTHYRVVRKYRAHTDVRVRLETGRTHQIRVHMSHAGLPLVGDPLYGGRPRLPPAPDPELRAALQSMRRQALHAECLELAHPEDGGWRTWRAPLPPDLRALLDALKADLAAHV